MTASAWGDKETQFFFKLTPDKVILTVEQTGNLCTGRCAAYSSMENRVYEVELDLEPEERKKLKSPSEARLRRHEVLNVYFIVPIIKYGIHHTSLFSAI